MPTCQRTGRSIVAIDRQWLPDRDARATSESIRWADVVALRTLHQGAGRCQREGSHDDRAVAEAGWWFCSGESDLLIGGRQAPLGRFLAIARGEGVSVACVRAWVKGRARFRYWLNVRRLSARGSLPSGARRPHLMERQEAGSYAAMIRYDFDRPPRAAKSTWSTDAVAPVR